MLQFSVKVHSVYISNTIKVQACGIHIEQVEIKLQPQGDYNDKTVFFKTNFVIDAVIGQMLLVDHNKSCYLHYLTK